MSSDNYVSPYGHTPLTDAAIDAVAYRHEIPFQQMADIISKHEKDIDDVVDRWWKEYMNVAMDKLDDMLNEYLPEES